MTIVQTKVFQATVDDKGYDVATAVEGVWTNANAFLATLNVNDVVDVKPALMPMYGAHGNKAGVHYQVCVIFLQH